MPLNMTFAWCTWGHWICSLQLQSLVLCFCGLSEAVGNINLVCISLFEALQMLLLLCVQEWVCAESCSSQGPGAAQLLGQYLCRISKSLHLVLLPGPCMSKASSYLRGMKHILHVPALKSWSKLRIPHSWISLCHTCDGDGNCLFWLPWLSWYSSLLMQKVLVLTTQTWLLLPGVSPCPCLGWARGASWFHFFSDFQASLPENHTHVLFAGLFGCDTSKEGFSAEEERSSEDLRMRKSNYHSAIAQHDLFNSQSLHQRWLQVRTMSLVTLLKQLGLSKPVWHLYRLLFCFIEGKYKFSKNLICRTKLLK